MKINLPYFKDAKSKFVEKHFCRREYNTKLIWNLINELTGSINCKKIT